MGVDMKRVSPVGLRLLKEYEGEWRAEARRCEGDAWEIGWGSTYYPDNTPVKEGDICRSEAEADTLAAYCLVREAAPVWRALNFEPNQNQIDALSILAYNVGGGAASTSSAVEAMNEGRWHDAAAMFALWTGSTSQGPSDKEVEKGWVDMSIVAHDGNRWRWVNEDGKYCAYFRRFRGLLRRHLSEGLLSLGLEWENACADEAIHMRTERRWNEPDNRWQDYIITSTGFNEVFDIARESPIRDLPKATPPAPIKEEPLPEVIILTEEVPAKKVKEPYGDYDPASPEKPIAKSRRVWGFFGVVVGWATLAWESLFLPFVNAVGSMPFVQNLSQMSPIDTGWKMGVVILMAGFVLYYHGQVKAKGPLK